MMLSQKQPLIEEVLKWCKSTLSKKRRKRLRERRKLALITELNWGWEEVKRYLSLARVLLVLNINNLPPTVQ